MYLTCKTNWYCSNIINCNGIKWIWSCLTNNCCWLYILQLRDSLSCIHICLSWYLLDIHGNTDWTGNYSRENNVCCCWLFNLIYIRVSLCMYPFHTKIAMFVWCLSICVCSWLVFGCRNVNCDCNCNYNW